MSPRWSSRRLEDYEDFVDDWEEAEQFQPIRRRERPVAESERVRTGPRKRDRERRREPPIHKREEL